LGSLTEAGCVVVEFGACVSDDGKAVEVSPDGVSTAAHSDAITRFPRLGVLQVISRTPVDERA
jgi:hypothetical protein